MLVNVDSLSDVNLLPSQWLVVLQGEGVIPQPLDVPFSLQWGIGVAEVKITHSVELSVRVMAWAGQQEPVQLTFHICEGDGDALTIGWAAMQSLAITGDLEALVKLHRNLGLTLAYPSPRGEPSVIDCDGKLASVSERELIQAEWEVLDPKEAAAAADRDKDFVEHIEPNPKELFIGRKSLEVFRADWMDSEVFVDELTEGGKARIPPMEIKLREGFEPVPVKGMRKYAPRVQQALDEEIARQLRLRVIEECDDPPMQEVVMVRKEDANSGYRFTLDARTVNAGMVVEPCNPPPVGEVIRAIAGCRYLARLDLASAYWQFPLAEQSRYLSAFRVGHRSYRYRVVYMGGMGASHHVQRAMQWVLRKHHGATVLIYVDDIVVATAILEEFVGVMKDVVEALQQAQLRCKIAKCAIGCYSIRLLGHIVDGERIRIADDKRHEVAQLPFPENPKQLRAALGQTNFQRAFVPGYAMITKPLTALVNKTTAEMQTPEARAAWRALMEAVAMQMSLYHLDYGEQIRVRVDASILGVGGALFNVGVKNGLPWERLIAVCSHAFTDTERNWATIEQEAFAMVFACRYWLPLRLGVRFVIDGDHRNLAFIHNGSSPKVVRWSLFLQGLDFFYNHVAGIDNFFPDRLSRQEGRGLGVVVPNLEDFTLGEQEQESLGEEPPKLSRAMTRSRKVAGNGNLAL
jgi:hypothetical protein